MSGITLFFAANVTNSVSQFKSKWLIDGPTTLACGSAARIRCTVRLYTMSHFGSGLADVLRYIGPLPAQKLSFGSLPTLQVRPAG